MRRTALWLPLVNALGAPSLKRRRARAGRVFDRMVADAERRAGADASLDSELIDSYRFLFGEFARMDGLSLAGWQGTTDDLTRRMATHLRVKRIIAETPEIAAEPITRPVVVVGLPRTATTLAHNVIVQPEGNRAPLMWELMNTHRGDIDPKLRERLIKDVQAMVDMAGKASPILETIHKMGAMNPEECIFALPHGIGFMTRGFMPGYLKWMEQRDYARDYAHLKQVLQVLQWRQPRKRWVLKSPAHLFNMDVLLETFPDATVVWTHRDPVTVMGSLCSLVETSWALHMSRYDPERIGPEWLEVLSAGVAKARQVRASASRERFVDVPYHSLTADPFGFLPKLFEQLDMPWTLADEANLEKILTAPATRRRHEYHLTRYGIDADDVEKAFGDYGRLGF
ncbi:MAG TPA: sulfotransferase [Glycomyces sp.]|nr:sulfotransferase [Glycomyces sp.]